MMANALMTPENTAVLLPVVQFKESHNLELDVTLVGPAGAAVVAPPYQAMSVGDTVTLSVKIYYAGDHADTLKRTRTLTALDIGQPLQWTVPQADLEILFEGDHVEVRYSVVYSTPTVPTLSEEQTLHIGLPSTPLLPRLAIKELDEEENEDTLDPEAYLDGITLTIKLYPGIQVGDYVLIYAVGDTRVIKAVRVDQTTVDSQKLEINLGYEWLAANNGNEVSLMYQYARLGDAGTSTSFSLMLRKPLNLPPPLIQGVIREGQDDEYKGYLLGHTTTSGVTIDIPSEAVIGAGDKVQMVWDGYKPEGHYIADPTVGNPRRFQIPKQYIPANLGKRLYVFYQVTLPGGEDYRSKRFDLHIRDIESGWPTIQTISPPGASNAQISLKTVTGVVSFKLGSWMFMEEGQRLRITATGVLPTGGKETFDIRVGTSEVVTEEEYYENNIIPVLPRTFLQKLTLNVQFDVIVETSFDGGFSYKKFPMISPTLVE